MTALGSIDFTGVILMVLLRLKHRHQIKRIDTKAFQVVKFVLNSLKVAAKEINIPLAVPAQLVDGGDSRSSECWGHMARCSSFDGTESDQGTPDRSKKKPKNNK